MSSDWSISIIIPAFNEEENIERAILSCLEILKQLSSDYEVIVINDGSTDNTEIIANKLAKENPLVKVLSLAKNEGMGAAVRLGIKHAQKELIFITCADNQFDIGELYKFLPPLFNKKADIVIGVRIKRKYTFFRKLNSKLYNILIYLLFGLKYRDPSWVKLYKRSLFDRIHITSNGFFWDVETLIKAKKYNFKVEEVEVFSYPRIAGVAKGSNPLLIIKTFFSMLYFWYKLNLSK